MGVAGSGKSTVAGDVARRLGLCVVDADSLHSAEAVATMRGGQPLADVDRDAWIDRVIASAQAARPCVVACSALRREHRDRLRTLGDVHVVHLEVPEDELRRRLRRRSDHFFPPSLLADQMSTFERPDEGERVATVDAARPLGGVVDDVVSLVADPRRDSCPSV